MIITEDILNSRIDYYNSELAKALKSVDMIAGALKESEGMLKFLRQQEDPKIVVEKIDGAISGGKVS